MLKSFVVTVLKNEVFNQNTLILTVEKPVGYQFSAGQFVKLTFPHIIDTDPLANWRWFSIASAPSESEIVFCGRIGISKFKKVMENLQPGDTIEISEAKGKFILDERRTLEMIFFAGGVGIAPIRSMVVEKNIKQLLQPVTIFYSNRMVGDAVYLEELTAMHQHQVTVIPTFSGREHIPLDWTGEIGRIDLKLIKRYLKDMQNKDYYIVGSPDFCMTIKNLLTQAEISEDHIFLEKFTGL